MLHAGLDLSRKRLDVCVLADDGTRLATTLCPPDADGLRHLVKEVRELGGPVQAVIESMNGARFVHDTLELHGWDVEIADAQKAKGLAPLTCKTDKIDAWVLAELSRRDLVPSIWLPTPGVRAERERARFRLHLVRHRVMLKNRIHATLLAFGKPCGMSDLFGLEGRELLARLDVPDPWRTDMATALSLIDTLDEEIQAIEHETPGVRRDPPLRPAANDRTGDRLGARLHDRRRDRRHPPLLEPEEARRLHRAHPVRLSIRIERPARLAREERAQVPALGAHRGDDACLEASRLQGALRSHRRTTRPPAGQEGRARRGRAKARRGHLAHVPDRRCVRTGKVPRCLWPRDGPLLNWTPRCSQQT